MSDLPPNIDAILASIRSRMNEDGDTPPTEAPAAFPSPLPDAPVADLGSIDIAGQTLTLETLVRSMLEPMLQTWLDANMPEIVERMAQAEINRLTGKD